MGRQRGSDYYLNFKGAALMLSEDFWVYLLLGMLIGFFLGLAAMAGRRGRK